MAEKRDREDHKHLCKLCNRRFPTGKSLGGHMRSHVVNNHNADRLQIPSGGGAANSGYGLRENPRKTWRAAAVNLKHERFNEDDANSWGSQEEEDDHEIEQEEVAICLMMLSRDLGQKFGGNLGTESSDNNSVILLGGSGLSTSDHAPVKKKQDQKNDTSDSGYYLNDPKELDSDDSVDGYAGNHGSKKYKPMFEDKHKVSKPRNVYWCEKLRGHKCPFCPKVFGSGQALGGHKRSHLIGCSAEDKAHLMRSVKRDSLIDLNLPAPVEEDGVGDDRYPIMHW